MRLEVLANWLYGIQVFLSMYPDEPRFVVMQNENFRTACLPRDSCGIAKMRLYVIQIDSWPPVDNQRCIKIGYYHEPPNGNKTKYYMAAAERDDSEVSITEDFDEGLLFNMSIANSLDFELFEPISNRYLVALPISDCAFGQLALVDKDHPARNTSGFKVYTRSDDYFITDLACC